MCATKPDKPSLCEMRPTLCGTTLVLTGFNNRRITGSLQTCFISRLLYPRVGHRYVLILFITCLLGTSTPPPENTTVVQIEETSGTSKQAEKVVKVDPLLENKLLEYLCDPSLTFPVDSVQLTSSLSSKVSKMGFGNL